MRYFMYSSLLALMCLALTACEQSVQEASDDLHQAEENAAERLDAERRDVEDAAQAGQEAVTQEQRELEDAAREEREKLIEEKRDLEDAARNEADPANP